MIVIALGAIVLFGWFSHSPVLVQLLPLLPPMTRNAAACFVLSGLALLMTAQSGPRWAVVLCSGAAGIWSLLTILEFTLGMDAGVDELLGLSYIGETLSSPGRMSPVGAVCFALGSIALLMAPRTLSRRSAFSLGLIGSIIAAVGAAASLGFALGSGDTFSWQNHKRVALHSAIGLCTLGLGMAALAWRVETEPAHSPRCASRSQWSRA